MLWVGFKEKRFDKFILFDTLLLVVLGAVSILLDNDIFFKLKPGLIEFILVSVLEFSSFSSVNFIGFMCHRYVNDTQFIESNILQMRKIV